jgi:REP element-mobilizing transposase RayT
MALRTTNGLRSTRRSKASRTTQLELPLRPTWGGRREGAGRKPGSGGRLVAHRTRPSHRAGWPVHVTLRSVCRSLRTQFVFPTIRGPISAAARRNPDAFRIAEFSVQGDHVHLVVEAENRAALIEGVRGLCIRIARRANQLLGRRGRFFEGRWHGRALTSPRAVRNALVYVRGNFRKHGHAASTAIDPFSSAPYFREFLEFPDVTPCARQPGLIPRALAPPRAAPVVAARTWLLRTGWKRRGRISLSEHPRA